MSPQVPEFSIEDVVEVPSGEPLRLDYACELSASQVARVLGRRPGDVLRMLGSGEIRGWREGSRWRVPAWALIEYQRRKIAER